MKKIVLSILAAIVLLVIGAVSGYYLGYNVGTNSANQNLVNPLEKATTAADTYKNPFKYQNPFDKIKLNPFAK